MKFKFITLFLFAIPSILFSQEEDFICNIFNETDNVDAPGVHSYSIDPALYENAEPLVLNVFYWKVKGPNGLYNPGGNPDYDFTVDKLLESIAMLNITFNKFNIYFKYRGYDSFDTPADLEYELWEDGDGDGDNECIEQGIDDPDGFGIIGRCQYVEFNSFIWENGYINDTALNIYVPYGTQGFRGGAASVGSARAIVKPLDLANFVMMHEVAHNLGVYHTCSKFNTCQNNEHTTRIKYLPDGSLNPDFNAETADDNVVDTAANSGFKICDENGENCYPFINESNCTYSGTETDELDEPFDISHVDVINTMSNSGSCRTISFTPGQAIRMREIIVSDSDLIAVTNPDASSLFEPYQGEYYNAGPVLPEHIPLFQPGFEYKFIECNGDFPQPANYGTLFSYNTNNVLLTINRTETDYRSITHPNHSAIWIIQGINDNQVFPLPEKCYNNFNKKPSGGSVTKFNDNVFNTNVTITAQDSTAINNQSLIQNLEGGLYRIEKNYNDGTIEETVIFKENN